MRSPDVALRGFGLVFLLAAAFTNPSQLKFNANQTGSVSRAMASKEADIISVKDFCGDTVPSDATVCAQAAITAAAGKTLLFAENATYPISAPLILQSNSKYTGKAKIQAKANSFLIRGAATGAMLNGTGTSHVEINSLEIDANTNGAGYGIWFQGGSNNLVFNSYIHDTDQAGIYVDGDTGFKALENLLINCGGVTATDNHGIMVIAVHGNLTNTIIHGNFVQNSNRKGITSYTANSATYAVTDLEISNNRVTGAGLAGIYVANQPGVSGAGSGLAPQQARVVISANYVDTSAQCMELAEIINSTVTGNACAANTSVGTQNVDFVDATNVAFVGNQIIGSHIYGINVAVTAAGPVTNNFGLNISDNIVRNSNQDSGGFGPGIRVVQTTYSLISGNVVMGETSSPKQTHGIYEDTTAPAADHNVFTRNHIANFTAAAQVVTGANTYSDIVQNNALTYSTEVDFTGAVTFKDVPITLVNGANNNVTLPSGASTIYPSGPTGVFNISGFAGGTAGRRITLANYSSFVMTINHNSASSSAGNKILIGGSADLAISAFGAVELTYVAGASAWIVTGAKT